MSRAQGLDDHWQNCTTICPNGTTVPSYAPRQHGNGLDYNYQQCVNASGANVPGSRSIPWYSDGTDPAMGPYGTPQVDRERFPDMKGMVSKAHGLGLRAGWCECCHLSAQPPALCFCGRALCFWSVELPLPALSRRSQPLLLTPQLLL